MTLALAITIGAILALLILSGFFSGSETALTAASEARMLHLQQNGDRRAKLVNELLAKRDRLISTLLLGNNLVNILASALATKVLLEIFGEAGVVYATLIMTLLVLVFSEVLPKTYALKNADQMSLVIAPVIKFFVFIFSPFASAVQSIVQFMLRKLGVNADANGSLLSAHDEIRGAIELHHRGGDFVKNDKDMLGGILDLKDLSVEDVMVHRTDMVTIGLDKPVRKIVPEVLSASYTRIPIWEDNQDNIIGVLHAKDLARALAEVEGKVQNIDIKAIASTPWFVPDTTALSDQLNAFLKHKNHFAMVVDEYGEVMGVLTLEDILEEIVGEISDEHDIELAGLDLRPDGSVNVNGSVAIRDLNRAMEWDLPDDEATTIAGLVIFAAQAIPEKGQIFTFYNKRFEILEREKNRITELKITSLRHSSAAMETNNDEAAAT